jgi:ribosomal protein S18 acetylase RimI-like enzyme
MGETQFKWLKVAIVAVSPQYRVQGVGRMLVAEAERIAGSRGCSYSFLDTMAYQAPDFYLKCGYALIGRIPDWDSNGHAKCFFTKHPAEEAGAIELLGV